MAPGDPVYLKSGASIDVPPHADLALACCRFPSAGPRRLEADLRLRRKVIRTFAGFFTLRV
jgi:hypothetical protein